jgi:putative ABC transport system permease protein
MMREDFGHAARVLRNSPMFAAAAVATIALGIGAGTAVFSVANAVLLRPLPYKNPDRLLLVSEASAGRVELPFFYSDFFDLRANAKNVFEDFAAINGYLGILPREDGTPDQVRFANVTTNFFQLMGAHIAFGRDFVSADGQPQPPRQPDDPGYNPHLPMRNPEARQPQRLPTMGHPEL